MTLFLYLNDPRLFVIVRTLTQGYRKGLSMTLTTYQWTRKSRNGQEVTLQARVGRDITPRPGRTVTVNAYILQGGSKPSTRTNPAYCFSISNVVRRDLELIVKLELVSNHEAA